MMAAISILSLIMCIMLAIWHGSNRDIVSMFFMVGFALANLPITIKRVREFMKKDE